MTTTVNDLVKNAYRELNVIREGGTPKSRQLTDGIEQLNDILDSLNLEKLIPFYIKRESFTLVAGTNNYTIGSGGTFSTTRPLRILKATITKDSKDWPMEVIDYDKWMDIYDKTTQNDKPDWLYYESNYPLGTIYINYTPSEANTLNIASENQFGAYADGDSLGLPPGYTLALTDLLAKRMWKRYPSKAVKMDIDEAAATSMARIRKLNVKNVMVESNTDFYSSNTLSGKEAFWNGN